jgi:hypothetical protein
MAQTSRADKFPELPQMGAQLTKYEKLPKLSAS